MPTLNLSGSVSNANGITLTILIYDNNDDLVWSNYPTSNFNQSVNLNSGDFTLDIMGYTQGLLAFQLSGYQTIDHAPPAQYNKRVSDVFQISM